MRVITVYLAYLRIGYYNRAVWTPAPRMRVDYFLLSLTAVLLVILPFFA